MHRVCYRRDILRWGTSGAAVLLAGGVVGMGCSGVRRGDLSTSVKASVPIPPTLEEMLYLASLAPSSHNTQPWRVRIVSETRLLLSIDPRRCLRVVDPQRREMTISLGAFIENFARAANASGGHLEVEEVADTPTADPLCTLCLSPGSTGGPPASLDAIRTRRTVRKGLSGDADTIGRCQRLASAYKATRFIPMTDPIAGQIGRVTTEAFVRQTGDDAAQAELADWIRLKNREAEQLRDGLSTESMEITGVAGWFVRTFMNRNSVMGNKFREKGISDTRQSVGEGAGWFVLTGPTDSVEDCIDVGRRFESLALSCVDHGIALHPMSQSVEYDDLRKTLSEYLDTPDRPQLIIRAGRVEGRTEAVSLRRPVSAFVV